eukprot:9047027-Alexandrium_andersonii.AAC.1
MARSLRKVGASAPPFSHFYSNSFAYGRGPEPSVFRCFCAGRPCSRGVGRWVPAGGHGPFAPACFGRSVVRVRP